MWIFRLGPLYLVLVSPVDSAHSYTLYIHLAFVNNKAKNPHGEFSKIF